jgi:hypothetical protein
LGDSLLLGISAIRVQQPNNSASGTTVDVSHGNYGAISATDLIATTLQGKYTVDDFAYKLMYLI